MIGFTSDELAGIRELLLAVLMVVVPVALLLTRRRPSRFTPAQLRKGSWWLFGLALLIASSASGSLTGTGPTMAKYPDAVQEAEALMAFLVACVGWWMRSRARFLEDAQNKRENKRIEEEFREREKAGFRERPRSTPANPADRPVPCADPSCRWPNPRGAAICSRCKAALPSQAPT